MKPGRPPYLAIFALPCLPFAATSSLAQEAARKSIQDALAKVDSGCPQGYPEIVTPLPEPGSLRSKSTAELTQMLENWNPSLRAAAANELGTRGDEVIPALRKATRSDNWTIRAGAATALAAIVKHQVSNWKEFLPGIDDYRQGQEKIKKKHDTTSIDLVRSPDILTSVAALENAPFTVGFAAETENVRDYALGKLENKKLDMIIANRVGSDCGFDYDDNAAEVLWSGGEKTFPQMPKTELAHELVALIAERFALTRGADTQPALSIVSIKD